MKKKNLQIIAILLLFLIALSIWGFTFYQQKNKNNNNNDINNNDTNNDNNDNYLIAYLCKDEYLDYEILYFDKNECQNEYLKIKTESPNASFLYEKQYEDYTNTEYVLYNDNGLKLYNNYNKESIDIPINYDDYLLFRLNEDKANHNIVGIILEDKEKYYSYYNIKENTILYENNNYLNIIPINKYYIEGITNSSIGGLNYNTHVIQTNEEKEIGFITTGTCGSGVMEINVNGGDYFAYSSNCDIDIMPYDDITFYTKENLEIINKEKKNTNEYFIDNNGNLNILEGNVINTYNPQGTLLKSKNFNDEIIAIYKNFYLGISNNTLYIKDYQNNIIKGLCPWTNDSEFYWEISGQFENYEISYDANNNDRKNLQNNIKGYYFVISTKTKTYEYYYNPDTDVFNSWSFDEHLNNYSISNDRIQF